MGLSPKSEFYNYEGEGLPFHQGVRDLGNRFPEHRVYCRVAKRVAKVGDILFSVRAPVGRMNIADREIIIGRGLCAIKSRNGNQTFIFQQLADKFHEEDMIGGGTIFKAVTKGDMLGIDLILPMEPLVSEFERIAVPMFAEIKNITEKNRILRQTRDLLLPKLVSGEIDVSELEIETGDAV